MLVSLKRKKYGRNGEREMGSKKNSSVVINVNAN
jgi:hypothetical protein